MSGKHQLDEPRRKRERTTRTERISQFTTPVEDDTLEFIAAVDRFKREKGRQFPSMGELLMVLKSLGYVKLPPSR